MNKIMWKARKTVKGKLHKIYNLGKIVKTSWDLLKSTLWSLYLEKYNFIHFKNFHTMILTNKAFVIECMNAVKEDS